MIKCYPYFLSYLYLLFLCCSCQTPQNQPDDLTIDDSRLMAWCIVPYDSQERGPAARMQMLEALGFSQYAYDWRTRHLTSFAEEIQLARQANIDMAAVWMWIDAQDQQPGKLSADNARLLSIMQEEQLQTDLWLGFPDPYFEGLDEEAKINKAAAMIRYLLNDTEGVISRVGLYNHGGWFGNPINQLKILEALDDERVGIVYNFHHAHEQIEDFPRLLKQMQPYLLAVNLNGMRKEGPKILTIGQGNAEAEMIHSLLSSGYTGPIGILGHVEEEDVRLVLKRNLQGLDSIMQHMDQTSLNPN
jgi:sugar phosphate isomerase/epimerase